MVMMQGNVACMGSDMSACRDMWHACGDMSVHRHVTWSNMLYTCGVTCCLYAGTCGPSVQVVFC